MRKYKIYLDTTIPSYFFNRHVPDKQKATKVLFTRIKEGRFDAFISGVLVKEVEETRNKNLRKSLIDLINGLNVLKITSEVIELAQEYLDKEIIHEENRNDALHIACASVYEMDFLISYNFEHIVKIKTINGVTSINLLLGYNTPRIIIPEEVLDV